ncbi:YciI family protein [Gryllotalpicola ginsengisoli]|uniref:YciI family protein n=1 Tax=Gryllotalpicola ginsengisoli TaxID=444608 RepID=UPI0003B4E1FD|nr:YciI family protein [Gryllotalpicola ginsengisoli]
MGKYLALIYGDESVWSGLDPEAEKAMYAEYDAFGEQYGSYLVGGEELRPNATAKLIRRTADGEVVVTDGAFGETKEALGGYYVIEADDEATALEVASHVPAPGGFVELRPIAE